MYKLVNTFSRSAIEMRTFDTAQDAEDFAFAIMELNAANRINPNSISEWTKNGRRWYVIEETN